MPAPITQGSAPVWNIQSETYDQWQARFQAWLRGDQPFTAVPESTFVPDPRYSMPSADDVLPGGVVGPGTVAPIPPNDVAEVADGLQAAPPEDEKAEKEKAEAKEKDSDMIQNGVFILVAIAFIVLVVVMWRRYGKK